MRSWKTIGEKSAKALRTMQDAKLRRFLRDQIYPFSPYYREVLDSAGVDPATIRTVDDLRRLPFTTKENMLSCEEHPNRPRDFILQPDAGNIRRFWPRRKLIGLALRSMTLGARRVREEIDREYRPIFLTFTTGRTSEPVPFMYTHGDIERLKIAGERLIDVFRLDKSSRTVNMFPYAPHLAFWQVAVAGLSYGLFLVDTGGGRVMGTEGNLRMITRMKANVLIGTPGYVYHLLRRAGRQGCDLSSVRMIGLGAERVPIGFKRRIAGMLESMGARDVRILGTYGFTEARMAWGECPTDLDVSSGYHLYPDLGIFEVVDPKTGEVLGEGESGELVYTTLDGRGSCVLRYRTGDLAEGGMTTEPCPFCGLTVPRISSRITRVSNIKELNLSKVKGTLVNFNTVMHLLGDDPDIEEWQIVIRKRDDDPMETDTVVVYIALTDGQDPGRVRHRISDAFVAETEISPNEIHVLPLPEMLDRLGMETEMKEKRIMDLRPQS